MMNIKPLNSDTIEEMFRRFAEVTPEPKGELNYSNSYTLLVAVVLSAQATDKGVNKATEGLFAKVQTPEQMLALGEAGLIEHIKTIGLYRNKARNIMTLSQQLVDDFAGEVPASEAELVSLAGVGRKTANVVLNTAFGQPTIAVDTHLFRVSHRLGLASGKTPDAVEKQLMEVVPSWALRHCHHWLILHGRYRCKARNPLCEGCVIYDLCSWEGKSGA